MCSVGLGGDMLVSRLVVPGGMVSWTVVGDDGLPVEPIECYSRPPCSFGTVARDSAWLCDRAQVLL